MRRIVFGIVLLSVLGGVIGCAFLEGVGPHPQLALYVEPFQAEVPYPFTILISVPEAGRAAGFQPETLTVIEPDGAKHRYTKELPFVEEIRPFAVTYPSPEWSGVGEPVLDQAGIYTVRLKGRFVVRGGRTESEATRMEDVFRGVAAGPLPEEALAQLTVPLAYTLSLRYPSRGYLVEVERGSSVRLPLRIQSRVEEPLRVRLELAPGWRVPPGVRLVVPEPEVELTAQGVRETTITLEAGEKAPTGDVSLYLIGEIVSGAEGAWPQAIPLSLRIRMRNRGRGGCVAWEHPF